MAALPLAAFKPRLLEIFKNYSRTTLTSDVIAGITVGFVALPLAMAFAIASGLKPESGIFTAIIAGFLISALGGSRVQIGGPAGAFIVVVYGIIAEHGVDGLLLSTIMAGALLFIMGLFKLGTLVRFVPVSIVIGFTNGIAVLIALSQIKDFFGLQTPPLPSEFFAKMSVLLENMHSFAPSTLALSVICLAVIFAWTWLGRKTGLFLFSRIPGSIIVLIGSTVVVSLFGLNVETIGSKFGGIPSALPQFSPPDFSWAKIQTLFAPAITIALLGAIESLLCARVADGLADDRHDPNQELMAQGVANIAAPLFGGFCATGTIARTVTNIRSGAKTPISGIVHAATLLAIILIAAPLALNVPLAGLAAILMFVAYNMGEWKEFKRLMRFAPSYRLILVMTFLLTVIIDLTVAVEVGLALSCLFFITRMSKLTQLETIDPGSIGRSDVPSSVVAYRLVGSLFFAAVNKLDAFIGQTANRPKAIVLDLSQLLNLDSTGLEALHNLHKEMHKQHCTLILVMAGGQPERIVRNTGLIADFGADNICPTLNAAFDRAKTVHDNQIDIVRGVHTD